MLHTHTHTHAWYLYIYHTGYHHGRRRYVVVWCCWKIPFFPFFVLLPCFPGSLCHEIFFVSFSLSLSLLLLLRILRLSIISSIETLLNSPKCKLFIHSFIHRIRHGRSRMAHEMVPGRRQGIFSRRPKSVGKATRDGEGSQRRQERPKSRLRWMHGL